MFVNAGQWLYNVCWSYPLLTVYSQLHVASCIWNFLSLHNDNVCFLINTNYYNHNLINVSICLVFSVLHFHSLVILFLIPFLHIPRFLNNISINFFRHEGYVSHFHIVLWSVSYPIKIHVLIHCFFLFCLRLWIIHVLLFLYSVNFNVWIPFFFLHKICFW